MPKSILDTLGTPLPIPKFQIGDNILFSYNGDFFIYPICGIQFVKCSDGYDLQYDTLNSIISESQIILSIKK